MIRLVVTDLDGTLWLGDGAVSQTTREAMRELARQGIPLLAATARRSWSAAHYLRQAELNLPAVLLNGALGRDKGGEPTFHRRAFDPGAVLAIGDGDNDVELFERAVHACAMSHATDRAKAAAHTTLSDGMDGWAQLLDYL
jgi:hydroxymethylpyrimidine pyrophosphatase-like HAD family hydrolase